MSFESLADHQLHFYRPTRHRPDLLTPLSMKSIQNSTCLANSVISAQAIQHPPHVCAHHCATFFQAAGLAARGQTRERFGTEAAVGFRGFERAAPRIIGFIQLDFTFIARQCC